MVDADRPKERSSTRTSTATTRHNAEPQPDKVQRAVAFKVTHILLVLFFLWLLIVHATGLYLFTKGFLLSRVVLGDKSSCDTLPNGQSAADIRDGCWHPRTFQKAVVVVIDALRYDFAVPFQPSRDTSRPQSYHNNLLYMYNTVVEHPERAFLLPFIADPPTSTLQRLKGLTAGNLPTFVDIGSNFAGAAIEEDNILVQLKALNKTIVHLGDDTWHSLFPGYFDQNLTHAYDSFNVWDLHTVDNGVVEHIFPLLEQHATSQWDVIFAHFLGVDHAGHWYGPEHPNMADKLRQMDRTVAQIAEKIDEDTVLVVLGDHGMDKKGDHGGESDEELQATLWVYSKRAIFGRRHIDHVLPPSTAKDRPVEQIDLVSTLSLLLGLPVPFNNLGRPIEEAFIRSIPASEHDENNLAQANRLVFDQMAAFQRRYNASMAFVEDNAVFDIRARFNRSQVSVVGPSKYNEIFKDWHSQTVSMYRKLWANFDLSGMASGAGVLLVGLVVVVLLVRGSTFETSEYLPAHLRSITMGLISGVIPLVAGSMTGTSGKALLSTTAGVSVLVSLSALALQHSFAVSALVRPSQFSIWTALSVFFTISQAAGFASNSYTIHEDTILTLLLGTFGVVGFMSSFRQESSSDRILGTYHSVLFVVLTRVASYSRLCRDEQAPGCASSFYASQNSTTSAPWQLIIPFVVALFLPEVIKAFYHGTISYTGSAGFWIGFSLRMGLLLVAAYWTIDAADNGNWLMQHVSSSFLKTINISLARCVYAIAIPVGIGTFIWAKPCIDIDIDVKRLSAQTSVEDARPQVTVLGYANAFGSHYFFVIPALVLSITVLLPPMGQVAMALCTWQILSLLEILDTNGLTITCAAQPPIGPVVLAMLGSYHFFKTGHQATLSSIQWNAAYVPLRTLTYPWAPILIILNNFGPQILCAAAVPLTALWKRPVSKQGLAGLWSNIMQACLIHMLYYATIQAATTIWAGHLRRHLMLYRVFMPRFLMASGVLLIVDFVLIVGAIGGSRVTALAVGEFFGY